MKPKLLGIQQKILMKSVGNLWRKFKILYKRNSYKAIPKLFIVCQFSFTQIFNSSLCTTAYDVMLWCAIGIKTKNVYVSHKNITKGCMFCIWKNNLLKKTTTKFFISLYFWLFCVLHKLFWWKRKSSSRSADDILFFDLINTFFQILGFFVSSSYNMKFKHSL